MAKKKSGSSTNRAEREVKGAVRTAKKYPKVFFIAVAFILIAAIVAGLCWYFLIYKKQPQPELPPQLEQPNRPEQPSQPEQPPNQQEQPPAEMKTDELSIHFLELGNKYAGDCTLIKIGDTEVLIDAGSRAGSAATIVPYIKQYCTDGILEYVIVTHADQDHISAFVGTQDALGVFESFECKTIIDFARTDKTTQIYQNYCAKRDAEVEAGAVHYTALQCWNETDGAQKSYSLADGVSMNILYNYYYENKSGDENNYSVCMLLTQGEYNYLFTGDLEEAGEAKLVQYNSLPKCKLFKGGHHGSKTSSTDALLSVIQPEYICICTCAGSPEYPTDGKLYKPENVFPTQDTIDRMSQYTANIYITTMAVNVSVDTTTGKKSYDFASMNGNIVVKSDGVEFSVTGSNNSTILKDTEWFQANRTWNGV